MNQKIHIIGSCATRDTFRILNKNHLVGRYTSRSSLISRLSPPLNFDFSSCFSDSNIDWKQRMIVQDFNKSSLYIEDYNNGLLIMDFLDEMFKLLKVDNTFITQSTEFMRLGLEKYLSIEKILSRGDRTDFDLWIDACYRFTNLIPKKVRERTVLHKAFWVNSYLEDGMINSFENQDGVEFFNKNLAYYYETFESIYSPGYVVEIPQKRRMADADHKWGLAPFHYTLEYYKEFYQQLSEIQEFNSIFNE